MQVTGWPATRSTWSRGYGNAQRSAAARAGLRREIASQAGWIGRRPVVEMALPVIAIGGQQTSGEPRPASQASVCAFSRSCATGINANAYFR